jgi:hypothetical protein
MRCQIARLLSGLSSAMQEDFRDLTAFWYGWPSRFTQIIYIVGKRLCQLCITPNSAQKLHQFLSSGLPRSGMEFSSGHPLLRCGVNSTLPRTNMATTSLTYWGYGFLPGSVAYPSPFQLSTGQNEAALYPWSSASFAACELSLPRPHVNTSVRSLGISCRASWRWANGI